MDDTGNSSVIEEQMAYYRARAAEYDEWFYRQGRYDRGEENNARWFAAAEAVREALFAGGQVHSVVELACGTGIWTQELAQLAQHVTALDASPEMLKINQTKVAAENVTYQQVNLFEWEPTQTYDMLFASFWLSHVPPERLSAHLEAMSRVLVPDGRLFLVDSLKTPTSTAVDHVIPEASTTLTRKLNDGRTYQIVKVFYEAEDLKAALEAAGFVAQVYQAGDFFWYVDAVRR